MDNNNNISQDFIELIKTLTEYKMKYDMLIDMIFDNAELDYNKKELRLKYSNHIMEFVKLLEYGDYNDRINELQQEQEKEENN